jgi:galactonate dehydratase
MRPAGSPAKAKETGGFRPAPEGQQKAIPTVILHGRWYEFLPRLAARAFAIGQPEMGRTGITGFQRAATLCEAHHVALIPHATIGLGLFMAASLQAASAPLSCQAHEFQHSVFAPNLHLTRATGTRHMGCAAGAYTLPDGPGLGVEPSEAMLALM